MRGKRNLRLCGCVAAACMAVTGACGTADQSSDRGVVTRPMNMPTGAGGASSGVPGAAGSGFGNPNAAGRPAMQMPPPGQRPDVCEIVRLNADPQVPDMMIVLDRSGSMDDEERWVPSVSAVRRVTTELDAKIRFGLTLFPDPSAAAGGALDALGCLLAPDPQMCLDQIACGPGKVVVPVGDMTGAMIGQVLNNATSEGGTPTSQTLERVAMEFAPQASDPDAALHPKYVLLVTDGQPTCPSGRGQNVNQADIDAANAAIDKLTMLGVKTYVIGYDTSGPENQMLASVLDGFAMRGGTMQHRPVEDEQSLLTELQSILGAVAGCSFSLDKAPPRADFVLVRLDGKQVNLNQGWQLMGEKTIELIGSACETLKDGAPHTVEAEVRCEVVVPM